MLADDASIPMTSSQKNETMATSKQQKKQQQQQQQQQYQMLYQKNTDNDNEKTSNGTSVSLVSAVLMSSDLNSLEISNKNNRTNATTATEKIQNANSHISNGPNKIAMTPGSNMTQSPSIASTSAQQIKQQQLPSTTRSSSVAPPRQEESSEEYMESDGGGGVRIKPEDLLELQERITKEILNSKLQEKEMLELQVKH